MTVTAAFCNLSLQSLLDMNGVPIRGGYIYSYDAETTDPRAVYRDASLATPHPFPIRTDAYGRIPPIYVGVGNYKLDVKDAANSLIFSVDDLPGGTEFFDTPATPSGWVTGDVKAAHTDDIQDGWLPLNGKTIGNAASVATARANADTQGLFTKLWNKDASLAVSGGRGATATADFTAGKTLALPDYRGRFFCGVDQMGAASAAGNITAFTTATPNTLGTSIGAEKVTLSSGQLPVITPSVTIAAAGGHSHTGTTDSQGSHSHGGSTSVDGSHTHYYVVSNDSNYSAGGGSGSAGLNRGTFGTQTGGAGAHSHTISTDGAHVHNVTTNAVADHVHTATAAAFGGGGAHPNAPPAVLGYWHIRL